MKKAHAVLLLAIAGCFGGDSTLKAAVANAQNAETTSREKLFYLSKRLYSE
ncbi:MAG: hypothetical protein RR386_09320 [Bacteroidaceae bacterium]